MRPLLLLVVLLTGCYSDKPVAPVQDAVFDERLLGHWLFPQSDEPDDHVQIVVARFNDKEYVVSPAHEFSATEAMRFFVTEVDGQRIINAQDLNPDYAGRDFIFARYRIQDQDHVWLDVPDLDAVPHLVNASSELVELFLRHADSQDFYGDQSVLVRRVPEE